MSGSTPASRPTEEHQPYSLEAQDTRLGAYIASQDGWELTRRYSDRMTGSVLERPELQRALGDARLHRFDLLLVYESGRPSVGRRVVWSGEERL
jgi:site-specific DNA recombinase